MKKFLHSLFIFFIGLLIGAILTFNTLGLILGNILYMELSNPQLNINLTSIVNHSQDLTRINQYQQENPNVVMVKVMALSLGDKQKSVILICGAIIFAIQNNKN